MSKYNELKSLDIWKCIENDLAWDCRFYLGYGIELTLYRDKMYWHKTTCEEPINLLTDEKVRRQWFLGPTEVMWKDISLEDILADPSLDENAREKILYNINILR